MLLCLILMMYFFQTINIDLNVKCAHCNIIIVFVDAYYFCLQERVCSGVKIPDENLTPQQRAHREEQLATIRKMQQMLFPESGGNGPNSGPGDGSQAPNEINPPNSTANMNMPFPPMSGIGPNGPMVSMPNSMNSGPSCTMSGPMGPNGPMGGPMGPNGPMGGPMGPGGPMGGMGGPGGMGMGHGSMGPNGMMGPNGPMMGGMGPGGPMGQMGPCGMKGIRGSCGGPDMKSGMCTDMHMGRGCGGPMGVNKVLYNF